MIEPFQLQQMFTSSLLYTEQKCKGPTLYFFFIFFWAKHFANLVERKDTHDTLNIINNRFPRINI